jgi:hypothetical protein
MVSLRAVSVLRQLDATSLLRWAHQGSPLPGGNIEM